MPKQIEITNPYIGPQYKPTNIRGTMVKETLPPLGHLKNGIKVEMNSIKIAKDNIMAEMTIFEIAFLEDSRLLTALEDILSVPFRQIKIANDSQSKAMKK